MVFTSFLFLVFLIVLTGIYYLCPARYRWIVLLLGSVFFYYRAGLKFMPFIVLTAVISYLAARGIDRQHVKLEQLLAAPENAERKKELKASSSNKCRGIMAAALVVIVGYLCYTKFALKIYDCLTGGAGSALVIIVPLGISYYTFSTVGYVLDVYWKRYACEKNFFRYLLYVMYFPHILQGPIARYDRLGTQLREEHRFDYRQVCFGVQLIVWGFFQKLVIADRLGIFVGRVYDNYEGQAGSVLLTATLFYAVQIYTDFAGCVNIAHGVSQMFGIRLEDNFHQPYFSKSVEEFWRRWHITLGAWFKDYLCMPVAAMKSVKDLSKVVRKKWGSQAGKKVTTVCALIAVWICTGVWHGTGWNYILWACWQGGIIIIGVLFKEVFTAMKKFCRIDESSGGWNAFVLIRTFILTGIVPRIITRAPSLSAAKEIFRRILLDFQPDKLALDNLYRYGLDSANFWIGIFSIVILILVSVMKEKGISIREKIASKNIVLRWLIYLTAFYLVVIFGNYGPGYDASAFVYMGF